MTPELAHNIRNTLNSAVISDVLDHLGYPEHAMAPHVRPLSDDSVLFGRARTGLYMAVWEVEAGINPYEHEIALIDDLQPDDVAVLACPPGNRVAPWGELLSTAARARKAAGCVMDGLVRDVRVIRQMGFRLAQCKYLVVTHADVDHVQGMARAKELLPEAKLVGHPVAAKLLAEAERISTYAEISAQGISIDLPAIKIDQTVAEGDVLAIGDLKLDVWHTPGHTSSQLSFRLRDLLFSGDNIFRDGCVGNIDAHHGSDLPDFISSLERIRDSDVQWLLPSHGPIFPKDKLQLQSTIDRLTRYQHMADFGTCAIDWPLLDEWDDELVKGFDAKSAQTRPPQTSH